MRYVYKTTTRDLNKMNELMSTGIELMLTGMGIVYLFLGLLVIALKTMSALVGRYFPEDTADFIAPPVAKPTPNESLVIAAISAAVHQHRNK
jgi:oxaloacetate decarboxylase (Na+ extruding) subunit gamma